MSVRIKLGPASTSTQATGKCVEVEGGTIRECLDSLIDLFPVFRVLLYGSDYSLGVLITYEGEVIVASQLDRPVMENDEVSLFPMVDGG